MYEIILMDEECVPEIPFFGGGAVPVSTQPNEISGFIAEFHKIPLLLALSLYTQPHVYFYGWGLAAESSNKRCAGWINDQTGSCVIGLRGTDPRSREDRADDVVSLF
jgi:hypothetical protein